MRSRRTIISTLFILLVISIGCTSSYKDKGVELTFEIKGIECDSLNAVFSRYPVDSKKKSKNKWTIHVPDSIYNNYLSLNISAHIQGKGWYNIMLFDSPQIVNHNYVNCLFFSRHNPEIVMHFQSFDEDNIILNTPYVDTEYKLGKEMASLKYEVYRHEISKEEALKKVVENISINPNSFALMKMMGQFLYEDIPLNTYYKLYSMFSEDAQAIPAGQSFKHYLENRKEYETSEKIRVFDLLRCDTGEIEPFLQDDGRYKLVIFSASWCSPCHKIIPLYKEIYNDLGDRLDMIYISIDKESDAEIWNQLIEKYEIPWKSYFSYNIGENIMQKYLLRSIPGSLLVNPGMTFEKIEVRDKKSRSKLYERLNREI